VLDRNFLACQNDMAYLLAGAAAAREHIQDALT
jgi:hypothetical protein